MSRKKTTSETDCRSRKGRRSQAALSLGLSILALNISMSSAQAEEKTGGELSAQTRSAQTQAGKAGGSFLEGSVKDEASLHPSIEVMPPSPKPVTVPATGASATASTIERPGPGYPPFRANASQYSGYGGNQFSHLGGAASTGMGYTSLGAGTAGSGYSIAPRIIPPISSYTLLPGTNSAGINSGLQRSAPGAGASFNRQATATPTSGLQGGLSSTPLPAAVSRPAPTSFGTGGRGVSTYAPGYSVDTIYRGTPLYSSRFPIIHSNTSASLGSHNTNLDWRSPSQNMTPLLRSPQTSVKPIALTAPQLKISPTVPGSGVNQEAKPGIIKNTLGGEYWSTQPKAQELHAMEEKIPVPAGDTTASKALNQPKSDPKQVKAGSELSLLARPISLPGTVDNQHLGWTEWYKRVAKAIYDRWEDADVGPGEVTVRVSVDRYRNLSGEVVQFFPALGVNRDVATETAFREAAVRAVNLVERFEIPPLPYVPPDPDAPTSATRRSSGASNRDRLASARLQAARDRLKKRRNKAQIVVSFDVEMKRTVDGHAGYTVAATAAR